MTRLNLKLSALLLSLGITGTAKDYTNGVFVLNEDWYGHNNSTLNFWNYDGKFVDYMIFQLDNPGYTLGATAQYGQIFGDCIYIMSKQDIDPGEKSDVMSGRLTIIDKKTIKVKDIVKAFNVNGNGVSIADGRGCVGVCNDKIYIGTSNGIYIYTPSIKSVSGPIAGSENPLITSNENNEDGQSALYQNQIGMMLRGQDYIFAIKQDDGILVIDPETDKIVKTIKGCFSTMVQSADGNIWVGVNIAEGGNAFGVSYQHYPYGDNGDKWQGTRLMCVNQYTLETSTVDLSVGGTPQSWYAWTAGSLTASAKENALYFVYGDPVQGRPSWFMTGSLYRYDIDTGDTRLIYDSTTENLHFYSSALRVNPKDDRLYAHLYVGDNIACKRWVYMILDKDGKEVSSIQPIERYWYPSMRIFPENDRPEIVGMPSSVTVDGEPVTIPLGDKVKDNDTPAASIIKRIIHNSAPDIVNATIYHGDLRLQALGIGTADVTVQFDSNGLLAETTLSVNADVSAIDNILAGKTTQISLTGHTISITGNDTPVDIEIYNTMGGAVHSLKSVTLPQSVELTSGFYIVNVSGKVFKIAIK